MALVADSPDAAKLVAGATAWQAPASTNKTLLDKWQNLFHAYDIHESGSISCGDFVKLEIRNGFEQGDLKRILRAFPTMSKADPSSKGHLDFMDFCKARLDSFDQGVPCLLLVILFSFLLVGALQLFAVALSVGCRGSCCSVRPTAAASSGS